MKKYILLLVLLFNVFIMYSQLDETTVMGIPTGTTVQINAVTPLEQGALAFDTDTKKFMMFDGSNWYKLMIEVKFKTITSNYTLTQSDDGYVILANSSSNITLTVPNGLNIGFNISAYQIGDGKLQFTGSGATIKNRLSRFKTAGKDAGVGLLCTNTNIFHLTGDLKK